MQQATETPKSQADARSQADTSSQPTPEDMKGQLVAIYRSQALIEYGLDGTILTANENFCKMLGYTLEELKGRHHSMLVEPAHASSQEFRDAWDKLGRGECHAGHPSSTPTLASP